MSRPTGVRTAAFVTAAALLLPFTAVALADDGTCKMDVDVDGMPEPAKLAERIRADARLSGACTRPWRLRVSPGPKGQFVIAVWNGSTLETRWASNAREIDLVTSLLVRTVVERALQAEAAASSSSSGSPSPPPSAPVASAASASGDGVAPPPVADARAPYLGASLGFVSAANAGAGPEGGLWFEYGTVSLRVGVAPSVARSVKSGRARSSLALPLMALWQTPVSPRVALGVGVDLGVISERAEGTSGAASTTEGAYGVLVGAWPLASIKLGGQTFLRLSLPLRYATTSATAASTASTVKGPSNPKANPSATKVEGPTDATLAENDAVARLGGVRVSAVVGLGSSF